MGKGFKRILLGEKMPDRNDPKYKERYEKEVKAGEKFAHWCKIDKLAVYIQRFANAHKSLFLVLVFGFVACCFGLNIYRLCKIYHRQSQPKSVIEMQDTLLRERRVTSATHHSQTPNYKP